MIAYRWHQDQLESVKRETIAIYEGKNIELTKQLATYDSIAKRQKTVIDSAFAKLNEKDTLVPVVHYVAAFNKVKALGTDSSISYLSKRLK